MAEVDGQDAREPRLVHVKEHLHVFKYLNQVYAVTVELLHFLVRLLGQLFKRVRVVSAQLLCTGECKDHRT